VALHKRKEAEQLYLRALAMDRKLFGPVSAAAGRDLHNLGSLYHDTHRLREAEELLLQSLATYSFSASEYFPCR
jgi:hypothetical protein